jgi:Alpha/beta hydrolase domain
VRRVRFAAIACSLLSVSWTTASAGAPAAAAMRTRPDETASRASLTASDANPRIYHAVASFSGPVTVGHVIEPLSAVPLGLASHGYVEQEFFAGGRAYAFRATSSPSDGRWTVVPTTSATYRTRIIVRRPSDPASFSGTVVVEWLNESLGESSPDWDYLNPELMSAGDAYVGVSVQSIGVEGGNPLLGAIDGSDKGLVQQEPQRYGSLHMPGDQYALDVFDQIGLGLRSTSLHVLGHLRARHIVAVGESQSAFYLTTFADTLQPLSHTFDGLFIHSRAGSGAPLNGSSTTNAGPPNLWVRTDLGVPVFMFETQTDLIELGYAAAQQPNTRYIRTWEVAGTSHVDSYLLGGAASVLGCSTPINTGPQHVVVQAAFAAFVRWVVRHTPPPSPRPFRLSRTHPAALALDRYGNVIGGVRTPAVDVPVSTLSGAAPAGTSLVCSLFGSTTTFSPQMLDRLYGTKAGYIARYTADLDRAIDMGYILPADRSSLLGQAREVQFSSS